MNLIWY